MTTPRPMPRGRRRSAAEVAAAEARMAARPPAHRAAVTWFVTYMEGMRLTEEEAAYLIAEIGKRTMPPEPLRTGGLVSDQARFDLATTGTIVVDADGQLAELFDDGFWYSPGVESVVAPVLPVVIRWVP